MRRRLSGWAVLDETNEQSVTPAIVPGADAAARFPGFQQVADSVVKFLSVELGDTCVVSLIDESGSILEPIAFAHRDPDASDVFREVIARRSVRVGVGNAGEVAETGRVINLRDLPGGSVRARIAPEHRVYADVYPVWQRLISMGS